MDAQLTARKGPFFRLLALTMLWAKSSFPVPLSPVIRTVKSEFANFLAVALVDWLGPLTPMMSLNVDLAVSPLA